MPFISARNALRYKMRNETMEGTKPATLKCRASSPYSSGTRIERPKPSRAGGWGVACTLGVSYFHSSTDPGCPVKDLANIKGSKIIKGQNQEVLPQQELADTV